MATLSIERCEYHPGSYAISINLGRTGTRLTPNKCCGRWELIEEWELSPAMAREIVIEIESVIDEEEVTEERS